MLIYLTFHKVFDINNCTKYRPITFTTTISKIFKNILKLDLPAEFLDKNKFFSKNNLSTNDALYYSTRIIYDN